VVQWFELGGEIQLQDSTPTNEALASLTNIQGLMERLDKLGVQEGASDQAQVSAAEFVLEGLHAHKRIGRSEERVFSSAGEKQKRPREEDYPDIADEFEQHRRRNRRPFN
jgi:magnesium chelatase subunit I